MEIRIYKDKKSAAFVKLGVPSPFYLGQHIIRAAIGARPEGDILTSVVLKRPTVIMTTLCCLLMAGHTLKTKGDIGGGVMKITNCSHGIILPAGGMIDQEITVLRVMLIEPADACHRLGMIVFDYLAACAEIVVGCGAAILVVKQIFVAGNARPLSSAGPTMATLA